MITEADEQEWYECATCCYGTTSYAHWLTHGQQHAARERNVMITDVPDDPKWFEGEGEFARRMKARYVKSEPPAGEWERGYAKGYERALGQMILMGCVCGELDRGECIICQTVTRLKRIADEAENVS